jgi:hypothetical protein
MSGYLSGRSFITTVDTGDLAADAVTLAKMAAGTDGNVISYDAAGDPVAIATGNDGQILTSAGAGNPPAFEAPAAASASATGVVELATDAEVNTGTDTGRAVTPANVEAWTGSAQVTTLGTIGTGVWQGTAINATYLDGQSGTNTGDEAVASTTVSGTSELATDAETITGSDTGRTVTPANLQAKLTDAIGTSIQAYDSDTTKNDANNTFTLAQRGSITTLADGANISSDMNNNNYFTVTLAGNRILDNPSNPTAGQSGSIFVIQDGSGSRTLSYGSYWDWPAGAAPTLTTTANMIDRIDYVVRTTTSIHCVWTGDVK